MDARDKCRKYRNAKQAGCHFILDHISSSAPILLFKLRMYSLNMWAISHAKFSHVQFGEFPLAICLVSAQSYFQAFRGSPQKWFELKT